MDYLEYLTRHPEVYQAFSKLIERTPNLCRYIESQSLFKGVNNFFSIGEGEGELEIALAKQYGADFAILDPVSTFIQSCKASATQHDLNAQLLACYCSPFEDFSVSQQFDRVLSIHSWYSFGFDKALLEKALSMVKVGGTLFINLMSKQSPVYGLSNMSYSKGIELCAEDLSEWASKEGYEHRFDREIAVRPASLFFQNDGELTRQAQDFASFLVAKPWADLSIGEQEKVKNIFMAHRKRGAVNIVSGCLFFYR